ncbi:hypothetical protein AAG747_25895 [Rapidithrix thailandica]|uniref:Outer membrane protein n=1 Tax=Rapidithrix thailandica TaxID=413964 RepID=A0AAW9SHU4_9BACT
MKTLYSLYSKAFIFLMLSCATGLISSSPLQAQIYKAGALLGGNFADQRIVNGGDRLSTDMVFRPHLGVAAMIPLMDVVSIQAALIYSGQGHKISGNRLFVNYLQLQLLGMYFYSLNTSLQLFGAFGPSLNLGVSGNRKFNGSKESIDFGEDIKRMEIALIVGGGIQLALMGKPLQAGLFYNLGMTNIAASAGNNYYNRFLFLRFTWFFLANSM